MNPAGSPFSPAFIYDGQRVFDPAATAVDRCHVGNMDDKRSRRRNRVLRDGKIVFNGGTSLINCIIRDQTEGGAKLQVPAPTSLPTNFELLCLTEGMTYPAQIAWRRGDHVGVAFVGPPRREARRKKTKNRPIETLD
jgi:hypothetical protein